MISKKIKYLILIISIGIVGVIAIQTYFANEWESSQLAKYPKSWIHDQGNGIILIQPPSGCPNNENECIVQFNFTVYNIDNDSVSTIDKEGFDVWVLHGSQNGLFTFLGQDSNDFYLIPNYDGIVYLMINETGKGHIDSLPTFVENPFFQNYTYSDVFEWGHKQWLFEANLTNSNVNWIQEKPVTYDNNTVEKYMIPVTIYERSRS